MSVRPYAFHVLIPLGLSAALLGASCDRGTPAPEAKVLRSLAPAVRPADQESPAEIVRQARDHANAGRWIELESLIDPKQARQVTVLLNAMDRLAWADRALAKAIRTRFGSAVAKEFTHDALVNAVGVFSRDVAIVSERIAGDRATVTIQVARRVPLEKVSLVKLAGGWRIQTDDPIIPMAREIERLAAGLDGVAQLVAHKITDVAQLRRELHVREAPVGRRLAHFSQANP